ncbi:MAG: hypothetical protein AAGF11_26230 [Myxococcota bacterium]
MYRLLLAPQLTALTSILVLASCGDGTGSASDSMSDSNSGAEPGATSGSDSGDDAQTGAELADTSVGSTTDSATSATATAGGSCADEFGVFTDPHGDGSLRLAGDDVFVLGPGPYEFSWICVTDEARLLVCEETTISLTGGAITVIGGGGLGPYGDTPIQVNVNLPQGIEDFYVFFDATTAPINMWLEAIDANITFALTGTSGVMIDGSGSVDSATYQGGGPDFPPCP